MVSFPEWCEADAARRGDCWFFHRQEPLGGRALEKEQVGKEPNIPFQTPKPGGSTVLTTEENVWPLTRILTAQERR